MHGKHSPQTESVPEIHLSLDPETLHRLVSQSKLLEVETEELLQIAIQKGLEGLEKQLFPAADRALPNDGFHLTRRQQEVLDLLKSGVSVKEIADRLGVTNSTIRTHISRMRTHLSARDLLELRFIPDC